MVVHPRERRPLGRTGMEVSPIGFGGSPLGGVFGSIDESDGIRAVHEAFKSGINLFDTSPFYGLTKSEEVLGRAIADLPRNEIIVATKVGRYGETEFDFSAGRVTASVEESLKRLQTDYLDIVQCHDIEFGNLDQIVSETLPALKKLKESGKIRAIGITGLPLSVYPNVLDRSQVELDLILSYCHNCLNDTSLRDFVPYFQRKGVGIVNASALSMGLLTPSGGPPWHPAPEELKSAARRAAALCAERNAELPRLALQYALDDRDMCSTLVGIESVKTLTSCLSAATETIDEGLLNDVLKIFEPVHNMTWQSGVQ
ncbi:hypothetical protein NDN08_006990 [Rhodosorus marinus]|uniref:NADP-dependent oxidoreductase domain-containing protein n=1 Tax=Rhodosorus marinus TaxID=101924 RepID=A0AAV8UKT0_9RHOD|nr:hypothetical protein NDN08_006990 [Rhodosorus marinus]